MFARASTIRFRTLRAWRALAAFVLALAVLTIATASSQACPHSQNDAAAQQIAAVDAAPAVSLWAAPADQGCCAEVSHAAGGCANGSCAPCSAALAEVATPAAPCVVAAHALPPQQTRTFAVALENFRPPRLPA